MLNKKTRIKTAITLFLASSFTIFSIFLFSEFGFYSNKAVALVENEIIYENDVKDELSEIFPNSDPATFQISKLPQHVLEPIAKEIYVKNRIYKNAKNSLIHRNDLIRKKIAKYSKKIISEYYINSVLDKKTSQKEINNKYLELSEQAQEEKQYKISHILVKTKYQAERILEKLEKKQSFKILAQKYSIDRKTNRKAGDLGYLSPEKLAKEFLIVEEMKKDEISQPIKTDKGWSIVKLTDVRNSKLEDFEVIKDILAQEIRKEKLNEIFSQITKDVKVKIIEN